MHRTCLLLAAAALAAAGIRAQTPYRNFESPLVHPMRLSADGSRLVTAQTADNRVAVWSLADPDAPVLLAEIPVGLEPVSVNARTNDEVWVVNHLSDSVSIVSVAKGMVVATLRVADEPSDVVFAGGKAFVSAAASDRIQVFDVATRAALASIPIFGKDPRALAVDAAGTKVYAVVERSGNKTTILRHTQAPPPPPPTNPALPAAPQQGLIVLATNPTFAAQIPYTLPDNDVVEIDVATLAVSRNFSGVGTTNTDIAVDPATGALWVTNIEARNLVRFEPNLRGHAIDSRVTRVTTGATPVVTPFDLNAGLSYAQLPDPAALAQSLAEPFAVAVDSAHARLYVAAQGTDRIGVLDLAGSVLSRIEVGSSPGAAVNTLAKRGPRALAFHAGAARLYVLNKMSKTISIIDTSGDVLVRELAAGTYDPEPAFVREGRRFLYDAKLSGNGTMSCASCHIDGDMDGIAWDLGDPSGSMQAAPSQPFPFNLFINSFHPMKGPMTTQTLKGLAGTEPLHWRGDRADFQAFNGAFASLLGGSSLALPDMNLFASFATAIAYPPNPNQPLNRSFLTTPSNANQQAGFNAFTAALGNIQVIGAVSCTTCHALPTGTNQRIVTGLVLNEPQQMKAPHLRNVYRKLGFQRAPGPQKSGFGLTHDGAIDTPANFLALSQFNSWPTSVKDDLAQYLLAFDTGTAPVVGFQVTLDAATAGAGSTAADLALLTARAAAGDIDLVAKGTIQGALRGLAYVTASQTFVADAAGIGPFTLAALVQQAQAGNAALTFTGVLPGSGNRIGRDRDLDGVLDGDEGVASYGAGTAGCNGVPAIGVNSEPRVGNAAFAFTASGAPAQAPGLFALGFAPAGVPLAGVTVLIDLAAGPPLIVPVTADASGWASFALAIPDVAALAGAQAYAQFVWADTCGPQGLSATAGLHVTVRAQ